MNLEIIDKSLKNPFVQVVILLLLVYLLLPIYLSSTGYLCDEAKITVGSCLDSSWTLSINWAIQKNLVFGKDYIFTYGALGFLGTRNALGFNPLYFLFFDLFIVGNLAYVLFYAIRRFANLPAVLLCFLSVYTLASISMYADHIVFILLLISLFWLNYSLKHLRLWSLIIPVVATCLLFYIKVNISFVALVIFYGYLIYFFFSDKENRLAKLLFGLSVPCLIILLSFPLRTDLIGYILGGLSLIDGYNDAMNIKAVEYLKYVFYAVLMISVFFISLFYKNYRNNLILLTTGLIFTFVLFKQSFVRSDLHITTFFPIFPALCGILIIFYEKVSKVQTLIVVAICAVCLWFGLYLGMYAAIGDRLNYLTDIKSPPERLERYEKNFSRFEMPAAARSIIGENTVDILPWNIDYLYFNRLNYNPRPVIQSYSAYTPYLIKLNRQKYESDSAPEFVIFSNQSIDNRYGFFDDQEVKLALIKDYSCVEFFESGDNKFLLFKRSPNNASIDFSPPVEKSIKLNEEYVLEDGNKSYFIKIDINYSLHGKLVRFAYKPFPILISFTLQDGSTRQHKAVVPILKNGVLINPVIEEEKDFFNFVKGIPAAESKKFKSFHIELDSPRRGIRSFARSTYDEDIKLSVSEVSINRNN